MAGTMMYMFLMLALGSGMVVLMFGFSSTHSAMYSLQSSFDEHDRHLKKARQANAELSMEVLALKKALQEARGAQQKLQAALDRQAGQLSKTDAEVRQEVAGQVRRFEQDLSRIREKQKAATTVEDDLKLQSQTDKASAEAVATRVAKVEQQLAQLSSKDQALSEQIDTHSKVHAHLRGLVEGLSQSVDEIRRQQKAEAAKLEESLHRQPAPTVAPPAPSTSKAVLASSMSVPRSSRPPSSSSAAHHGVSIPSSAARSSLSSSRPRQDADTGQVASDSDHHALRYRRTPDSADDTISKAFQISWYRECGCTGMEIEAVTLLAALVQRLGAESVRTNKCSNTCLWSASTRSVLDKIEVHEDSQLTDIPTNTSRPGGLAPLVVLVVHAAFSGVCGVPDSLLLPTRRSGDLVGAPQRGLLRVSRSMLETDRLQEDIVGLCNEQFDAIWVPSQFNVRTFSRSGVNTEKLHVLHEAVDTAVYNCSMGAPPQRYFRGSFGSKQLDHFVAQAGVGNDFTFLSIFKWEARKNWRALLETFLKAFPHNVTEVELEDGRRVNRTVRLLVKTQELSWGTSPDEDLRALFYSSGSNYMASVVQRVMIFKDALPAELMPSLYHVADAFVLPTHGEGWGLPLMEAMASGLPTIATNWGGQTEFMNEKNSFLLGSELVNSDEWGVEGQWAEPNATDLRQAMLEVVRRTERARSRAERGCREVHTLFTPEVVARRVVGLIAQLQAAVASS